MVLIQRRLYIGVSADALGALAGSIYLTSGARRYEKTFVILLILAGAEAAQSICDRACLTGILHQYLNTMAANDSTKAPFGADIEYTENAARLPLNEGLWFTAAALTDYKRIKMPEGYPHI
jgi:hypothetical protein